MHIFLKKILIFSSVILVINFGIKLLLDTLYFKEYNNVYLGAETYLLSDSHGAAIGEFEDGSIYNFSSPSDSYLDIERKLEFLIKMSKIKRLLITVDEHTLSPYRSSLNNSDRSVYYSSMDDFPNIISFFWERYIKYNLVILNPKYGPIIKNYLKSLVTINSNIEDRRAWSDYSDKERQENSVKRYEKQFEFENSSKELSNSLKRIISLCKSKNIDIIGVKFPISEAYRKTIGKKNYQADFILKNYGIDIIEFNSDEFANPEYFKDQDHLNAYGAEKFKTAILDSITD